MSHTNPTNYEYLRIYESQRGISLLFIVLITSLILAIGLGISALLIQELRMMSEIGYSVIALYAADSGIEAAIYDLYQSDSPYPKHSDQPKSGYYSDNADLGDARYETFAKCCNPDFEKCSLECPTDLGFEIDENCNTTNYCLKSLGSYKKVKRAIEIKY